MLQAVANRNPVHTSGPGIGVVRMPFPGSCRCSFWSFDAEAMLRRGVLEASYSSWLSYQNLFLQGGEGEATQCLHFEACRVCHLKVICPGSSDERSQGWLRAPGDGCVARSCSCLLTASSDKQRLPRPRLDLFWGLKGFHVGKHMSSCICSYPLP